MRTEIESRSRHGHVEAKQISKSSGVFEVGWNRKLWMTSTYKRTRYRRQQGNRSDGSQELVPTSLLIAFLISGLAGCQSPTNEKAGPKNDSSANGQDRTDSSQIELDSKRPNSNEAASKDEGGSEAGQQRSGGVFFVEPKLYSTQRSAFSKNSLGAVVSDVVLLPAEVADHDHPSVSSLERSGYVGAQVCGECHSQRLADYSQTAHYKTSALVNAGNFLGDVRPGHNQLTTRSPNLSFEMFEESGTFYQRLILNSGGETLGADFSMDIATGSGKTAQTYLRWEGGRLYQLHATYVVPESRWVNSPGFDDGVANFARPIHAVCLECHSTFFQPVEGTVNQFDKHDYLLGISCERCHGPGKDHVRFHQHNPDSKIATDIVHPSKLDPEREIEICQVCHGGLPKAMKQPTFSFRPGDKLDEFYEYANLNQQADGIHTNTQLPRLQQSRCFQESESMTCTTCHNPHRHERGDVRLFSERCIECHEPQHCGKFDKLGPAIADNCIDCHMPSVELQDITFHSKDGSQSPSIKDHFIRVVESR
ncbi:MAG: multiheme c-type cytochrome [Aureliella sp.]